MTVAIKEQHTVDIGQNTYIITALGTSAGFETMKVLREVGDEGIPDPLFIRKLIVGSVTVNNMPVTVEKYEQMFSRKFHEAIELFQAIVKFNFGVEDPNVQGDTSET